MKKKIEGNVDLPDYPTKENIKKSAKGKTKKIACVVLATTVTAGVIGYNNRTVRRHVNKSVDALVDNIERALGIDDAWTSGMIGSDL